MTFPKNQIHDCILLRHHIVVPEPKHTIPLRFDALGAECVLATLFIVLSTIDFDNEACLDANEIGDEACARMLATEFETVELSRAEVASEDAFGVGGV